MSRAFVKEEDGGGVEALPDLPVSLHKNLVTLRGQRLLQQKYRELADEKQQLQGMDDMSGRQRLAEVERDLRYYSQRLESAQITKTDETPTRVHFGCTVDVLDEDDEVRQFTIVGEDEADIAHGLISWLSPLAQALNEAETGDEVTWERPAGSLVLEIISIQNHQK